MKSFDRLHDVSTANSVTFAELRQKEWKFDPGNDYLHAVTGEDFTAKDFRTWAGTVLASMALREFEESPSETQTRRNVVEAIKAVAQRLRNTPVVCRKCYVHPAVLECYLTGKLQRRIRQKVEEAADELLREAEEEALRKEESAVMELLQRKWK